MQTHSRRAALAILAAALAGCGKKPDPEVSRNASLFDGESPRMRTLINKYARTYDVPAGLIHRVVQRESGYNPAARNGPYYGLMQILPQTARTMGYRGDPQGLLDAETNLTYAVKYLRGAWLLSHGSYDTAVMWYAKGYYYEAKRKGLLEATELVR